MISRNNQTSIFILSLLLALIFVQNQGIAQSEVTETTKKVVIVKKTIDENGNETIEKKVLEGKDAEAYLENKDIELEELIEKEMELGEDLIEKEMELIELDNLNETLLLELENMEIPDIDVDVLQDGENHYKIKIIENGETIEWNSKDGLPQELNQKIRHMRIEHPPLHGEDAVVWIQEEAPDRAVLGVMVENAGGNGAMITDVFDDSGAQKAGLQKGDIIIKVNKTAVSDIESLVASMKGSEVGETVKVKFLRSGKKKSEKVELGKMPMEHRVMPKMHKMKCHPKPGKHIECHVKEVEKPMPLKKQKINKIVVVKKKGDEEDVEVITEDVRVEPPAIDIYQLNIYPNPSDGEINIEFTAASVPTTVKVISLDGKEIYSRDLPQFDGNFYDRIDLNGNEGGAILQIHQNGQVFTETIMK